ncbi:conserved exported hypothetical protein [Candidatus Sulfopaludibacter sp. SbA3]|nr:conserved exported hypothetical protein [Candidatus Sulfopaludibacter sp. SbA3]
MRSLVALAFLPSLLCGATPLQIVQPIVSQSEGGVADAPGTTHIPGEILFFTCRIANYAKTPEEKIHLAYSVQPFDPKGVPLAEIYKNEMTDEVSPQDKEWMPRIATEVAIPPLVLSGDYKIVVKVEDVIAHATAELTVPFRVRGHEVVPSDKLVVRNLRFFRGEEDTEPVAKAAYKPGSVIWVKFDITGYKYGPGNKIDVSYIFKVLSGDDKVLFTNPEAAGDQTESFYPKSYVTGEFSVPIQPAVKPGSYAIAVVVTDAVGNQTCEVKHPFTVE